MRILNVHERAFPATPEAAGALLESLAGPADRLWPGAPSGRWPPMRLDRGLAPGSRGGHGPIRYRVVEHVPGRQVRFAFEQEQLSRGLFGHHWLQVEARPGGTAIRHVIDGEARGAGGLLRWHLLSRPLHDALLEDALDRAELALTGQVSRPARWSPYVRLAMRLLGAVRRRRR